MRRFEPLGMRCSRTSHRVSRLLTDQMATINFVKNAEQLEVMLPIIGNVRLLRSSS